MVNISVAWLSLELAIGACFGYRAWLRVVGIMVDRRSLCRVLPLARHVVELFSSTVLSLLWYFFSFVCIQQFVAQCTRSR